MDTDHDTWFGNTKDGEKKDKKGGNRKRKDKKARNIQVGDIKGSGNM